MAQIHDYVKHMFIDHGGERRQYGKNGRRFEGFGMAAQRQMDEVDAGF